MKSMNVDELTVKYMGMERGKVRLSRKAVLEEQYGGGGGNHTGKGSNNAQSNKRVMVVEEPSTPPDAMSQEELDVIAQAIDGVEKIQ